MRRMNSARGQGRAAVLLNETESSQLWGTADDEIPPQLLHAHTPHKANACLQGQPRWLLESKAELRFLFKQVITKITAMLGVRFQVLENPYLIQCG